MSEWVDWQCESPPAAKAGSWRSRGSSLKRHSHDAFQHFSRLLALTKLRKSDPILAPDKRVRVTTLEVGRGRTTRISLGEQDFVYLQVSGPACLSASPWYSLVKWQHSSGPTICLTPWIVGSNISSHSPEPMTDGVQRWLGLSALPRPAPPHSPPLRTQIILTFKYFKLGNRLLINSSSQELFENSRTLIQVKGETKKSKKQEARLPGIDFRLFRLGPPNYS